MKCNGIQCIYAWLTGRSICLLYICIVLDLAVGVVVCKASVLDWLGRATWSVMVFKASLLNWLGVHLPSIYMHCSRSSSGCNSMQDICAQLTGGSICLPYVCIILDLAVGAVVCKASVLDWLGSICLLYICIVLDLAVGVAVMQGIYAWMTGGSNCLLYIALS